MTTLDAPEIRRNHERRWPFPAATAVAVFLSLCAASSALQSQSIPTPPAYALIKEPEIRADMLVMAGDAMRGRESGTLDEMRASIWTADQLGKAGVKPFGEDGGWFQWFNMRRTRIATTSSSVRIAGRSFALWTEVTPTSNTDGDVIGTTVFAGDGTDSTIDVRGRVAVITLKPTAEGTRSTINTPEYRAVRQGLTAQGAALTRRGASAVIIVADALGEANYDAVGILQSRGTYNVLGGAPRFSEAMLSGRGGGRGAPAGAGGRGQLAAPAAVPVLFVHRAMLAQLRQDGQGVEIHLKSEAFDTPSVNIIGMVRGTDPTLRDEYVVFSSHQDHDGVRFAIDGDSIWNGADDNASTSVALFAIARAWAKQPAKRSALFVFHGAEERGLLGSRWHAAHPVVPLGSMVAVLNGDMIGQNHADTASLLGSQPPHQNSTALVQMAFEANNRTGKFVIDSTWDRPSHPEGFYFRSDHASYAQFNVPSIFFTTKLHPDYHTPRDDASRINYPKLTRMTQWMFMTGWIVANAKDRPSIDPGFKPVP
ncbi:MAG: peptidase M28 [Gemmatimonadetes bacterium]|nr:MAG: peptidase M28 [Gemmatimonadota bacterium]PHX96426.1 MAG: peptidase M28 [Gemmatimonadota bacterium]